MSQKNFDKVIRTLALTLVVAVATPFAAHAEDDDFMDLDLAALADLDIEVTSVGKKAQSIFGAPAAIAVVTDEDIRKSGATSIPEALRLVPGMQVGRIDSNSWAVSARGFNSEFANKLLVLIDGRSVYTPLFAGVYWDVQDIVLEDIARIEVIRGPGATVWGANAVNGVINIITKEAKDTQGFMTQSAFGDYEGTHNVLRYGGAVGDDLHYRVYAKYFNRGDFKEVSRANAQDEWDQGRIGFRSDWQVTDSDVFTWQGDGYLGNSGSEDTIYEPTGTGVRQTDRNSHADVNGWNTILRWSHSFSETHNTSLQVYWDRTSRESLSFTEVRDTADVDFQHSFSLPFRNSLIWGAGYRWTRGNMRHDSLGIRIDNPDRRDNLYSAFVQNDWQAIPEELTFTLGTKVEHNEYTGWEFQPSGRFSWTPNDKHTLWGSASRAVRTPSVTDHELGLILQRIPSTIAINSPADLALLPTMSPDIVAEIIGNEDFESETVKAFELGYRIKPHETVSLDFAAFYNIYRKLSFFDPTSPDNTVLVGSMMVPTGLPSPPFPASVGPFPQYVQAQSMFQNEGKGYAAGLEFLGTWQVHERVRLTATYAYLNVDVDTQDGVAQTADGSVPSHTVGARAAIKLPWSFEFDTHVWWTDALPANDIGSYWKVDTRLAYTGLDWARLEFVGLNLTEGWHQEMAAGLGTASLIPRQFYARATLDF